MLLKLIKIAGASPVSTQKYITPGGGVFSLMWPMQERATGQGTGLGLYVLNRAHYSLSAYPKQGMVNMIVIVK